MSFRKHTQAGISALLVLAFTLAGPQTASAQTDISEPTTSLDGTESGQKDSAKPEPENSSETDTPEDVETADQTTDAPAAATDSGVDGAQDEAPAAPSDPADDDELAPVDTGESSALSSALLPLLDTLNEINPTAAANAAAPVISELTVTPQSTKNGDYTSAEVDNNVVMEVYYLPPAFTSRRFAPFVPSAAVANVPDDATVLFNFYPGDPTFTVPSESVIAEDLDGDGIYLSKWDRDGRDDSPGSASVDFIISGSHPDMVPGDTMRFEVAVLDEYNNILARSVRSGICFSFCDGDGPETTSFVLNSETTLTTQPGANITCGETLVHDPTIFPLQLVTFCLEVAHGSTHEVTLTYDTDQGPEEFVAKKYDPSDGSYAVIESAVITERGTIGVDHQLILTYSITDNGVLDQDPTLGQIVDPVGLSPATVIFADQALEDAVNDELSNPHGTPVTIADAAGITSLNAPSAGISDLSGIEHLVNVTGLILWDNSISDASPLAGLTNLTSLSLDMNEISDVSPLAGLNNLINLYLHSNEISDVSPLASLTGLTNLNIQSNEISDLSPLAGMTGLTSVNLQNNEISDVSPLAGLTNLTDLWLSTNEISDVSPLSTLTNLTWLVLHGNEISDVSPLASLTNLTDLFIYNQSVDLPSALVGASTVNPVVDGANNPVPVSSSAVDFAFNATSNEWTFTDPGAKTITWSSPVSIGGASNVDFSGTISQNITSGPLPLDDVYPEDPEVIQAACIDGDVVGPQINLPVSDWINYTIDGEVTPGETVTVRATVSDDFYLRVRPDSDWVGDIDYTYADLEVTLDPVDCAATSVADSDTNSPARTGVAALSPTGTSQPATAFGLFGVLIVLIGTVMVVGRGRLEKR